MTDIDIVLVEEAEYVSEESWRILIPTIRKEDSEIWLIWNPESVDSATRKRFILNPPSNLKIAEIMYYDNPWFPAVLEAERQDMLKRDPELYRHVWLGECWTPGDAFITYALIESCTSDEATEAALSPLAGKDIYIGVDIGRRNDLTVIWVLERVGDVLVTRAVIVLKNEPFKVQRDILYHLIDIHKPRRVCIDESGIGMQLTEEAAQKYGSRIEPVLFNNRIKEDMAYTVKRRFEQRELRVPRNPEIANDITSVKRYITTANNIRFDAARTDAGHGDRFWALALACQAAGDARPQPIAYERVAQRRTWDNSSGVRSSFAGGGTW